MQKSKFVAEAVGSAGEIGFVIPDQNSNLDCSFHSNTVEHGKSFSFTFEKAGRYQIFCNVVPNMIGTVIVSLWSLMRQKR